MAKRKRNASEFMRSNCGKAPPKTVNAQRQLIARERGFVYAINVSVKNLARAFSLLFVIGKWSTVFKGKLVKSLVILLHLILCFYSCFRVRSKYFDRILACLVQTHIKVLFSDCQGIELNCCSNRSSLFYQVLTKTH